MTKQQGFNSYSGGQFIKASYDQESWLSQATNN
jgi:hypothetical protein